MQFFLKRKRRHQSAQTFDGVEKAQEYQPTCMKGILEHGNNFASEMYNRLIRLGKGQIGEELFVIVMKWSL